MTKLSEDINYVVAFLSGIIFSNAVAAAIQGQLFMAFLSLLAIGVGVLMKRFIVWDAEE
ncbi:MAG: hypothetical protein HYY37_06325 [Candidatus Aenigmarchaeota archaeon]|nr:hypothetical protein [Candidatus Aenigmarchaeota archaeon]